MSRENSLSPSPSPKRQRLSSPTYDEHFSMTQDEINAFDEFEKKLSQTALQWSSSASPKRTSGDSPAGKRKIGEVAGSDPNVDECGSEKDISQPSQARVSDPRKDTDDGRDTSLNAPSSGHVGMEKGGENEEVSGADQGKPVIHATPARKSGFGFASALELELANDAKFDATPSSSPDLPAELDYSSWFESGIPEGAVMGFQSAKTLRATAVDAAEAPTGLPGFTSGLKALHTEPSSGYDSTQEFDTSTSSVLPSFTSGREILRRQSLEAVEDKPPSSLTMGFTSGLKVAQSHPSEGSTASTSFTSEFSSGLKALLADKGENQQLVGRVPKVYAPSSTAVARASNLMKEWQESLDKEEKETEEPPAKLAAPSFQTPSRTPLRAVENAFSPAQPPESPTPAARSFAKPLLPASKMGGIQIKNKPFKSPMMRTPAGPSQPTMSSVHLAGSPLNPARSSGFSSAAKLPAAFPSASMPPPPTPLGSSYASSSRALGLTPRRLGLSTAPMKKTFKTPFKPGMAPGQPGRLQLEQSQAVKNNAVRDDAVTISLPMVKGTPAAVKLDKGKGKATFFDLKPRPACGRLPLLFSKFRPQSYTVEELAERNIDVVQLEQITLDSAEFYKFNVWPSGEPDASTSSEPAQLGMEDAFNHLQKLGCTLATKAWVDNHWRLILWKLAGMTCLDPDNEAKISFWSWENITQQLLYRYERELNNGSRPPLRLITTHDAPPTCPMVLCVSKIFWSAGGISEDGSPIPRTAELEVTDGWYKLHATVDEPMQRAIRKGKIRVGCKLTVENAKLISERKEPTETLEAYESMCLQLSGNSCHLAPWHTKLGFEKGPHIATLDSLTADGGIVTLLEIEVIKAYSVAYTEFIHENGQRLHSGAHDEKEERKRQDQWQASREAEESNIRERLMHQVYWLTGVAEVLERRAGPTYYPPSQDESMPDHIGDLLYEFDEDHRRFDEVTQGLSKKEAGWLAKCLHTEADKREERVREDVQQELQSAIPPRDVRNFRVVVARDARWQKRKPLRHVQITVWDVLNLTFSEGGKPGDFKEGDRFLVTNLYPNAIRAWMPVKEGAMIYLINRGNTRWTKLRRPKAPEQQT